MRRLLALLILLTQPSWAQKSILIEDTDTTPIESYKWTDSGADFRVKRKMGLGVGLAGVDGLMGAHMELNFSPEMGFRGGFGVGNGYQTFNISVKKVIPGAYIAPYFLGGYTRWSSTTSEKNWQEVTPSYLNSKFLRKTQRNANRWSENILFPGLGLQYLQLKGSWAGFSVFAEVLMLVDMDDLVSATTGSIGVTQYF